MRGKNDWLPTMRLVQLRDLDPGMSDRKLKKMAIEQAQQGQDGKVRKEISRADAEIRRYNQWAADVTLRWRTYI